MRIRRSILLRATGVAALAGVAAACSSIDPESQTPLQQPSRAAFALEAGPILAKRCGDFSCHGDVDRPYSVYAVGRMRLDPRDLYRPTPLSRAEFNANYDATLGFLDAPRGRDTLLMRKALAVGGPGGHRGGAVFEAPSDPECKAVIAWIEGPR